MSDAVVITEFDEKIAAARHDDGSCQRVPRS
jgi:hypothetical protein